MSVNGLASLNAPYYYRVAALNGPKRTFSASIGEVNLRPATPTNLRVASSHAKTYLSWASKSASGFQVERSTDPTMTTNPKLYTVRGDANEFTPYGLTKGKTYYYRVRALNAATPSTFSAVTRAVTQGGSQSMKVMTYNIKEARFDGVHEGGNTVAPWSARRKAAAAHLIENAMPDVIGVQEGADLLGHHRQVDTLRAALHGRYALAHTEIPPGQPHTRRTGVYIMYNKSTYRAVGRGGHWNLGEKRSAAHQVLANRRTGAKVLIVSTHLFHGLGRGADMNRRHETQKLLRLGHSFAARKGLPIVYVGDFNSDPFKSKHAFDAPAQVMRAHHIADAFNVAQHRSMAHYDTGNGYRTRPPHVGARIDYVFAPQGVAVNSWRLVMRLHHGKFVGTIPSDHNPLLVTLSYPT
jgi:endonuclease/exonuclease/phosphatase family metal-dependent hydrolase